VFSPWFAGGHTCRLGTETAPPTSQRSFLSLSGRGNCPAIPERQSTRSLPLFFRSTSHQTSFSRPRSLFTVPFPSPYLEDLRAVLSSSLRLRTALCLPSRSSGTINSLVTPHPHLPVRFDVTLECFFAVGYIGRSTHATSRLYLTSPSFPEPVLVLNSLPRPITSTRPHITSITQLVTRPPVKMSSSTNVGVQPSDFKLCVAMVGLPARGKSFIAQKGKAGPPWPSPFHVPADRRARV